METSAPKYKPLTVATTVVGSFPQIESEALSRKLVQCLDIPAWPQLPRRAFYESMYVQYSAPLPGVVLDTVNEKITLNTRDDLSEPLEQFYSHYLADDVDAFALLPNYAAGFFTMMGVLAQSAGQWAKGQVTGPISFGLTVTDQDLRPVLYHELLADALVKNAAMNARWQVRQLRRLRPNVLIFVDEPYMAAFGSAFISLEREPVITMLDEVFAAVHQEKALAGVHCCANTDWSVLLSTSVDVLNLDAYGYLENLALYPAELRTFLDRDGRIAWGIVPNNAKIFTETAETLAQRLWQGFELISQKAQARGVTIGVAELVARSLITPSCGLGSTTIEVSEQVLRVLAQTAECLHR